MPVAAQVQPEFFVVSPVNISKSQILLKRPSEVTVLMQVNKYTRIPNQQGKPTTLSDFRAGSTVWIHSAAGKGGGKLLAVSIREGRMTVQALHRPYLHYPVIH